MQRQSHIHTNNHSHTHTLIHKHTQSHTRIPHPSTHIHTLKKNHNSDQRRHRENESKSRIIKLTAKSLVYTLLFWRFLATCERQATFLSGLILHANKVYFLVFTCFGQVSCFILIFFKRSVSICIDRIKMYKFPPKLSAF